MLTFFANAKYGCASGSGCPLGVVGLGSALECCRTSNA